MKTNKSYTKRLKVSKNGKIKARSPGQNHFNAKESRNTRGTKSRSNSFAMKSKDRARFLSNSN